jgi:type I restriction enzyme, S subunit
MSQSKKLIPRRRFKECENSQIWKQSYFLQVIINIIDFRGRTPKKLGMDWSECGFLALSALNVKNGYIDFSADAHYGDNNLYLKWMGGNELRKGQVIFTTEAPMGNVAQIPDDNGYILSQRTIAFEVNKSEITDDFLAILLKSPSVYNSLLMMTSGGTAKGVSQKSLSTLKINLPSSITEQTQIGEFFKKLDNLINTQQKKLEKAKTLKSAYLREMFPNEGELKPRLRFNRFIEDWKPIKLGEAGSTSSGIGFPDNEQGGEHGIPFYKVSDMNNIGNEIEMKLANNYVTSEQISNRKWNPIITIPAIIFAKVGAAIMLNRKRLVRTEFLIDNNMMAYIFDNTWDINFGKVLFETINLAHYSQVGALPSYNSSDIEKIDITFPNTAEQTKIGNFFKLLDNKIALEQKKLNKLKNIKQAYLNEMFV